MFDLFPVPLNTQTLISHHFHNTLSHTLSHTLFHTHSFTHTLSHTLFHTHSSLLHTLFHTHSFTHTLSHTLLSLTHTLSHTHTHTHSFRLLPGLLHDGWLLSAIQILSASGDEHYSDAEVDPLIANIFVQSQSSTVGAYAVRLYVKCVFIVHVGCTRCVPSSTDNTVWVLNVYEAVF